MKCAKCPNYEQRTSYGSEEVRCENKECSEYIPCHECEDKDTCSDAGNRDSCDFAWK